MPHPRQNSVPVGKIPKRNSLRVEAKFDGLIIISPLLDFDEVIELHSPALVKPSLGQIKEEIFTLP